MRKRFLLTAAVMMLALGLTACGEASDNKNKNDSKIEQENSNNTSDADNTGNTDESGKKDSEQPIAFDANGSFSGDKAGKVAAYNKLIKNVATYVQESEALTEDYYTYDYMYYDYDLDDDKELILYLEYDNRETGERSRDVVFMDYDMNTDVVYVVSIIYGDLNDQSFYADYLGRMSRYSWVSVYEAYLDIIEVRDGQLCLILEKEEDHLVVDMEAENLRPLPLYGNWEMIFED